MFYKLHCQKKKSASVFNGFIHAQFAEVLFLICAHLGYLPEYFFLIKKRFQQYLKFSAVEYFYLVFCVELQLKCFKGVDRKLKAITSNEYGF